MKSRGWLIVLIASAGPLAAHVVSTSTGEIRVEGAVASYEFRIPTYELQHMPETSVRLLDSIHFHGENGSEAQRLEAKCGTDPVAGMFVCRAKYLFDREPEGIRVTCDYPKVTVPHHLHILTAIRKGVQDQAFFDASFRETTLTFRKRPEWEYVARRFFKGFGRAFSLYPTLLFLLAFVFAANNRRDLWIGGGIMAGAMFATAWFTPQFAMQLPPRFVPAAAWLSSAYLAADSILAPQSGWSRRFIAGLLGLIHGAYLGLYSDIVGPRFDFLMGSLTALGVMYGLLALLHKLPVLARLRRPLLVCLGVISLAFFVVRLTA